MPFAYLETPSIALSILRGIVERSGRTAHIDYFTFELARRVGRASYDAIARQPGMSYLAGEWVFSDLLFGHGNDRDDEFVRAIRERQPGAASDNHGIDEIVRHLRSVRCVATTFLDHCRDTILARNPRIVGFTSVFQQHVPTLALAKRLKAARPDLFVVVGGPNCDDVLGVESARRFPFVDAVVYGEADEVFADLVDRVCAGAPVDVLQGVYGSKKAQRSPCAPGECESTAPVHDLDATPFPRYDDYLSQLAASGLEGEIRPELLLEASRGCWWGEKHHCVFCGLNDVTMVYRHKSADRVLREIAYMTEAAPGALLFGTDPIFNMRYFRDLVPELTRRGAPASIYFETKANLRDDHVEAFYGAGIRTIQPGVESLITSVLRLMDKGVSAAQNVRLLRSCEEHGVQCLWNYLWGLPGESADAYGQVAPQLELLSHLHPPDSMGAVVLLRFSPLYHQAERFGLTGLRHYSAYDWIYPDLPAEARENLAYYFDYDGSSEAAAHIGPVAEAITRWRAAYFGSILFFEDHGEAIELWDTRPCASSPHARLTGATRDAFLALRDPLRADRLRAQLGKQYQSDQVADAMNELRRRRLIFPDGDVWTNVAVDAGRYPAVSATHETSYIRGQKLLLLERARELLASAPEPERVGAVDTAKAM